MSKPETTTGSVGAGRDRLYGERVPVEIDEDVRETYWTTIRGQPENRTNRLA
jgi:hypothetical protein